MHVKIKTYMLFNFLHSFHVDCLGSPLFSASFEFFSSAARAAAKAFARACTDDKCQTI